MVNVAIVCEGKTDEEFLETLRVHLQFEIKPVFYRVGGKINLFNEQYRSYEQLKMQINTDYIQKVLFVVDADDVKNDAAHGGYENTQASLTAVIDKLGFNPVAETYIMCDPVTQIGYLESLLLSTISSSEKQCIESFLQCSQFKAKDHHKAILNDIYKLAYPNAPYDFSHPHFDGLKEVLTRLFSQKMTSL